MRRRRKRKLPLVEELWGRVGVELVELTLVNEHSNGVLDLILEVVHVSGGMHGAERESGHVLFDVLGSHVVAETYFVLHVVHHDGREVGESSPSAVRDAGDRGGGAVCVDDGIWVKHGSDSGVPVRAVSRTHAPQSVRGEVGLECGGWTEKRRCSWGHGG